jgi:hypothetical protein
MKTRNAVRLVALGFLTTVLGCRPAGLPHNDKVEGTVTLDGVKLPGVVLEFMPLTPTPGQNPLRSRAVTDKDGHFSLTCANDKPGAVVSRHRVTVSPDFAGKSQAAVPVVYRVSGSTPLYVEITADEHAYDLKLSKNAKSSGAREPGD